MTRLSALLASFIALSTGLAPVLSLSQGNYTLSQERPLGEDLYLHSELGFNESIEMIKFNEHDKAQQWRVDPLSDGSYTISNVKYGCNLHKDPVSWRFPPLVICGEKKERFSLTPVSEKAGNVYYIDIFNTSPIDFTRMHKETILTKVTFTSQIFPELPDPPNVQISYRKFIFTPVSDNS
ncbi:unnamed protein product [Rhizoctonia solani]|uniref:Ricin B lectin domain-containing protein n=1 Tax=Rhizoctonia solani TaxID=456999 RepID=A0A8H3B5N9_9AGAM|nr:unnamed protein product [Rhizoctonia solani]